MEPCFLQDVRHLAHDIGLTKTLGGNIHADADRRIIGEPGLPPTRFAAGLAENPVIDPSDQASFLGDREECRR